MASLVHVRSWPPKNSCQDPWCAGASLKGFFLEGGRTRRWEKACEKRRKKVVPPILELVAANDTRSVLQPRITCHDEKTAS